MKKIIYIAPKADIYGDFEDVITSSALVVETTPAVTTAPIVTPDQPELPAIPGGSLLDGGAGFGEEQNYIK